VTVTLSQRLRGVGAFGAFMVRRANRQVADEALDRLGRLHGH